MRSFLNFRRTSKILPEALFTHSDGFRHGDRVDAPAGFPPFIISFPKIRYVAFLYHLRDTALDGVAYERHVFKFIGFWSTSAVSQPDLVDSDMDNCPQFRERFDLENGERGTLLMLPCFICPDLSWDEFGIFGNFGRRALTRLVLGNHSLH